MNMLSRNSRYAGVTLLEAMLVLVLISTIIVMSMRYYQGATNNSQVTGALAALQSAAGNIESYGATTTSGNGVASFANLTNVYSPLGNLSISGTNTASTVVVGFANTPSSSGAVCSGILSGLNGTKWTANTTGTCAGFKYNYTS